MPTWARPPPPPKRATPPHFTHTTLTLPRSGAHPRRGVRLLLHPIMLHHVAVGGSQAHRGAAARRSLHRRRRQLAAGRRCQLRMQSGHLLLQLSHLRQPGP